jgi:hypothetical protein
VFKVIALICLAFTCVWAIELRLLSAVRVIEHLDQKTNSGWDFVAQNLILPKIKDQARMSVFLNTFFLNLDLSIYFGSSL